MLKTLIGLLALGIVVIVHELGHFIAARLSKVDVESFSIGWGPLLFRKKIGRTEYRLSALPLGGYCGMKGEHAFQEALEKGLSDIRARKAASSARRPRACISRAGGSSRQPRLRFVALPSCTASALATTHTINRVIRPISTTRPRQTPPAARAGHPRGRPDTLGFREKQIDT
jgi:regulator of sigma E protease